MGQLDPVMWSYKINDVSSKAYNIICYHALKNDVVTVCLMGNDNILNQYIQDIATLIYDKHVKYAYTRESRIAIVIAPISLFSMSLYTVVFKEDYAIFHKVKLAVNDYISNDNPEQTFISRENADTTLAGVVPESFIRHWNMPSFLKEERSAQ